MPSLTVALPVYNSAPILWLALEGLCRQEGTEDLTWELIVCEEPSSHYAGEAFFEPYRQRLAEVGCYRLVYVGIKKWVPLAEKWVQIARRADDTDAFVLCAADDYSYPTRLDDAATGITQGHNWLDVSKGHFLNLTTKKMALYNHALLPQRGRGRSGLFMATRTALAKTLPTGGPRRYVDNWMKRHIGKTKVKQFPGPLGLLTDGWNQISHGRKTMYGSRYRAPFAPPTQTVQEIVPDDVAKRLRL